jgi:hypothetical protein
MLATQKWVVCEESGRWAAAIRVAFSRWPKAHTTPRLYEARTLGELSSQSDEHGCDLALVEVDRWNLTHVLELLERRGPRAAQIVALLQDVGTQRHAAAAITGEPSMQAVADLLWEAGAVEIVESPRQMCRLSALHNRLAVAQGSIVRNFVEPQSFAERAWATLPWQER